MDCLFEIFSYAASCSKYAAWDISSSLINDSIGGCVPWKVGLCFWNVKIKMTENWPDLQFLSITAPALPQNSSHPLSYFPCPPALLPLPTHKQLLIGRVSSLVPLLQGDAGKHKASGLGYFTCAAPLHLSWTFKLGLHFLLQMTHTQTILGEYHGQPNDGQTNRWKCLSKCCASAT